MRCVPLLALALVALPALAQDVPTGLSLSSGYATGFEAGAVYAEARVRFALPGKLGLEPLVSWTRELPYLLVYDCMGVDGPVEWGWGCSGGVSGDQAFGVGAALTYRAVPAGLPLGLDGAHVAVTAQRVLPFWDGAGYRLGAEVGAEVQVVRQVRLGTDVQVARYTDFPYSARLSVAPVVRLAVGR